MVKYKKYTDEELKERSNRRSKKWREENPEKVYEANRKYRLNNPKKILLVNSRCRARRDGIEHSITENDFSIPELCPILEIPLIFEKGIRANSPSLDRVDNSKGYVPGNVKVISTRANYMKGDMTIQNVRNLLRYMENEI